MRGRTNVSGSGNSIINANVESYVVAPGESITAGNMVEFYHKLSGNFDTGYDTNVDRRLFRLSDGKIACFFKQPLKSTASQGNDAKLIILNYDAGVYSKELATVSISDFDEIIEIADDTFLLAGYYGSGKYIILSFIFLHVDVNTNAVYSTGKTYNIVSSSYSLSLNNNSRLYSSSFYLEKDEEYIRAIFPVMYSTNSVNYFEIYSCVFTLSGTNIEDYLLTTEKIKYIFSLNSSSYTYVGVSKVYRKGEGYFIFFGYSTSTAILINASLSCLMYITSSDMISASTFSYTSTGGGSYFNVLSIENDMVTYIYDNYLSKFYISSYNGDGTVSIVKYDAVEILSVNTSLRRYLYLISENEYKKRFLLTCGYGTSGYARKTVIMDYDKETNDVTICSVEDAYWDDKEEGILVNFEEDIIILGNNYVEGAETENAIGNYKIDKSSLMLIGKEESINYVKNATNLVYIRGIAKDSGTAGDTIDVYVPSITT